MIGRAGVFTFRPAGKDLAIRISGYPRGRDRCIGQKVPRPDAPMPPASLLCGLGMSRQNQMSTIIKAAAVQISPVLYSRQGTVEKVVIRSKRAILVFTRYASTRSLR